MSNNIEAAGITWGDAPVKKRGAPSSSHWNAVADALRSRPNEWAKVAEGVAASTAMSIKRGTIRAFPAGEFEAKASGIGIVGRADIYARYVGPKAVA